MDTFERNRILVDLLRVMLDAHSAGDNATKKKAEALYEQLNPQPTAG